MGLGPLTRSKRFRATYDHPPEIGAAKPPRDRSLSISVASFGGSNLGAPYSWTVRRSPHRIGSRLSSWPRGWSRAGSLRFPLGGPETSGQAWSDFTHSNFYAVENALAVRVGFERRNVVWYL